MELIEKNKEKFEKVIEFLKRELFTLRTGRASSTLVENLAIEAYGSKMPLKQLASISTSSPKEIIIQPWDRNIIKEIERAISSSNLGINPVVQGEIIRLVLPPLTEERRKDLIKIVHQKMEQARVSIREIRDEIREEIIERFRKKEIGEDLRYKLQEELDKFTQEYNDKVKEIDEGKEKEILTI